MKGVMCPNCGHCIPDGESHHSLRWRFERKVNVDGPVPVHRPELGPCHVWIGAKNTRHYGKIVCGSKYDGTRRIYMAHRAAWFLTHGAWPRLAILHLCDNPSCVRAEHLREGTIAENNADTVAKGRHVHGETHPRARLSNEQVLQIKAAIAAGGKNYLLAERFGVGRSTIATIRAGKQWRHL